MTKVVYIMGAGRSGSTLLGVALDAASGFFYAGELDAWLRRRGVPNDKRPAVTAFWQDVAGRLDGSVPEVLLGTEHQSAVEHSASFLRPRARLRAKSIVPAYRRFNKRLFDTVAALAESNVIVDSSHYPLRARELRRAEGLEMYLVLLVRSPHGVVNSFKRNTKQGEKSLVSANVYIWLTHLLSVLVYVTHPRGRRMFLRYERLVREPADVVAEIGRLVGSPSATDGGRELQVGRAFQGNRLLQSSSVRIEPSHSRVAERSVVTMLAQLPWTIAFAVMER